MIFMLDTNIIIYAKNKRPEGLFQRLMECPPEDICISVITMAELEYGVFKSSRPDKNRLALSTLLSGIRVVPFDFNAAREYGDIREGEGDAGEGENVHRAEYIQPELYKEYAHRRAGKSYELDSRHKQSKRVRED